MNNYNNDIYIHNRDTMLDFLSIRLKEMNKHHQHEQQQQQQLLCLNSEMSGHQPFFRSDDDYKHFISTSVDHTVNLEQGCVPTMIVTTNGDDDIISVNEIEELMIQHMVGSDDDNDDYHRIMPSDNDKTAHESSMTIGSMSSNVRGAMLSNSDKFNDVVYKWLEANM